MRSLILKQVSYLSWLFELERELHFCLSILVLLGYISCGFLMLLVVVVLLVVLVLVVLCIVFLVLEYP